MELILMINLISLWTIVLLILWLTLASGRQIRLLDKMFAPLAALTVGQMAPNFIAQTLDGETVTRDTFAGREVVFIFVFPSCTICREKIPALNGLYRKAKETGVDLVLVSTGNILDTKAMAGEIHITLPILLSPPESSSLASQYNPDRVTPFYCFINAYGIVVSSSIVGGSTWNDLQQKWQ